MAKETKTKRVPIGGKRDILAVRNQDPNFVYRWVNDTPGRIERFKEAGYEVVQQDVEIGHKTVDRGSKVGSAITRQVGGLLTAVCMRIPKEWYDEDQKALENRNEQVAAALRGGLLGAEKDGRGDTQHRYVDKARTTIPDLFTPKRPKAA